MYKAVSNIPGGNLSEFFHNYNLRSRSELTVQESLLSLKFKFLLAILDR